MDVCAYMDVCTCACILVPCSLILEEPNMNVLLDRIVSFVPLLVILLNVERTILHGELLHNGINSSHRC